MCLKSWGSYVHHRLGSSPIEVSFFRIPNHLNSVYCYFAVSTFDWSGFVFGSCHWLVFLPSVLKLVYTFSESLEPLSLHLVWSDLVLACDWQWKLHSPGSWSKFSTLGYLNETSSQHIVIYRLQGCCLPSHVLHKILFRFMASVSSRFSVRQPSGSFGLACSDTWIYLDFRLSHSLR